MAARGRIRHRFPVQPGGGGPGHQRHAVHGRRYYCHELEGAKVAPDEVQEGLKELVSWTDVNCGVIRSAMALRPAAQRLRDDERRADGPTEGRHRQHHGVRCLEASNRHLPIDVGRIRINWIRWLLAGVYRCNRSGRRTECIAGNHCNHDNHDNTVMYPKTFWVKYFLVLFLITNCLLFGGSNDCIRYYSTII